MKNLLVLWSTEEFLPSRLTPLVANPNALQLHPSAFIGRVWFMASSNAMNQFTVYLVGGGDESYEDGCSYKIADNGVLMTLRPDRQRKIYSPTAWHHIDDRAPERKPATGMVVH